MDRCYFAKESPEIEIRGGIIFILPKGGHCEIALAPATLAGFVASANRALDQIYEHRRTGIVKMRSVG